MSKDRFEGLYSFSQATKIWGLKDSTLRKAVKFKFKVGVDCKKMGKDWIVTEEAMIREYGKPNCDKMYKTHKECSYCKFKEKCKKIAEYLKPSPKDYEDDGIVL